MDSRSPSSASSSTLVQTPLPNVRLGLNSLNLNLNLTGLSMRGPAPKGPLQPHVSNLPRRRRPVPVPVRAVEVDGEEIEKEAVAEIQEQAPPPAAPPIAEPVLSSGCSSASVAGSSSSSPSPSLSSHSPSSSLAPSPSLSSPSSSVALTPRRPAHHRLPSHRPARGPLQPAHANLPRRRMQRPQRRPDRGMQALGRSGVFVAFGGEGEEEEEGFDVVVRIGEAEGGEADVTEGGDVHVEQDTTTDDVDQGGGGTLRLTLLAPGPPRDDGVPRLRPAQLRALGAFVRGSSASPHSSSDTHSSPSTATPSETQPSAPAPTPSTTPATSTSTSRRRRILICAPRARALEADVLGAGVCLVLWGGGLPAPSLALAPDAAPTLSPPTLSAPTPAPAPVHAEGKTHGDAENRVHRLLVAWHDCAPPSSAFSSSSYSSGDDSDDHDSDLEDDVEEDGRGQGRGRGHGGEGGRGKEGQGLRDEWRGVLSRGGMDYLEGVLCGEGEEGASSACEGEASSSPCEVEEAGQEAGMEGTEGQEAELEVLRDEKEVEVEVDVHSASSRTTLRECGAAPLP
ncbi:hypothetical protein C8R44DRAFT_895414 [Mycena epipterygia]|nr:hypothetical protein C8R44DRAFT_895414 [Mycena epipterygia]